MYFHLELIAGHQPYGFPNLPDYSCSAIVLSVETETARHKRETEQNIARLVGPHGEIDRRIVRFGLDYETSLPILGWLSDDCWHADNLFVGQYFGVYYPALIVANWGAYNVYATSGVGFSCAHCAYLQAVNIADKIINPHQNSTAISPTVLFCKDANDLPQLSLVPETEGLHATTIDTTTIKVADGSIGSLSCRNCGFPGHNSRTCSRIVHYDKVGVEIEGRFTDSDTLSHTLRAAGIRSCGDGSIRLGFNPNVTPLEIQTKPGTVFNALQQVVSYYPDETDSSCGMHVHVSFKDTTHFTQLTSPEFFKYFRARWRAWGESRGINKFSNFWNRLNGHNDYCRQNRDRDADIAYSGADRYLQLNFHAYSEHQTVECRLLPMFQNAALAVDAIVELVNIYEDWLARDAEERLTLPKYEAPIQTELFKELLEVYQNTGSVEIEASFAIIETSLTIDMSKIDAPSPGETRVGRAIFAFLGESETDRLLNILRQV